MVNIVSMLLMTILATKETLDKVAQFRHNRNIEKQIGEVNE